MIGLLDMVPKNYKPDKNYQRQLEFAHLLARDRVQLPCGQESGSILEIEVR